MPRTARVGKMTHKALEVVSHDVVLVLIIVTIAYGTKAAMMTAAITRSISFDVIPDDAFLLGTHEILAHE